MLRSVGQRPSSFFAGCSVSKPRGLPSIRRLIITPNYETIPHTHLHHPIRHIRYDRREYHTTLPCRNSGTLTRARDEDLSTRTKSVIMPPGEKFKVLFLGRDEFSCLVFEELVKATDVWDEILIATQPDEHVGRRGSTLAVSPLKLLGEKMNIPVHEIPSEKTKFRHWKPPAPFYPLPGAHRTATSQLTPIPPTHILITASFGRILSAALLDLFSPTRRLNVHPSLLPAYRGPAPIQHSLINGDAESGVCVIEMLKKREGIDTGAIWGTKRQNMIVGDKELDFVQARELLGKEGGRLLVNVLREMIVGTAESLSQRRDTTARSAPMITAKDWTVDFDTLSPIDIVRRQRAISHQRPLTAYLPNEKSLQLHEASVYAPSSAQNAVPPGPLVYLSPGYAIYHKPTASLLVRCSADSESVLSVPRVKMEGKKLMSAGDWWNGMKGLELLDEFPEGLAIRLGAKPPKEEAQYGTEILEIAGMVTGKLI